MIEPRCGARNLREATRGIADIASILWTSGAARRIEDA